MLKLKLFFILIVLLLSSCCRKDECEEYIDSIELNHFSDQDVDSVIVKSYLKNSNFTVLSDSIFTSGVHPVYESERLIVNLLQSINYELEYKIEVLSINTVYIVTGFEKKKKECSSCLLGGNSYYDVLNKYYVNGTEKYSDGNGVVIDK